MESTVFSWLCVVPVCAHLSFTSPYSEQRHGARIPAVPCGRSTVVPSNFIWCFSVIRPREIILIGLGRKLMKPENFPDLYLFVVPTTLKSQSVVGKLHHANRSIWEWQQSLEGNAFCYSTHTCRYRSEILKAYCSVSAGTLKLHFHRQWKAILWWSLSKKKFNVATLNTPYFDFICGYNSIVVCFFVLSPTKSK